MLSQITPEPGPCSQFLRCMVCGLCRARSLQLCKVSQYVFKNLQCEKIRLYRKVQLTKSDNCSMEFSLKNCVVSAVLAPCRTLKYTNNRNLWLYFIFCKPLVCMKGNVKYLGIGLIIPALLIQNFMKMTECVLIHKVLISVGEISNF